MNYARFLNRISAARISSPIRKLTEIQEKGGKDLISFGTGAPNPSCFPLESLSFTTKEGKQFSLSGPTLTPALQYGPTKGNPGLLKWLKECQSVLHGKVFSTDGAFDILITPGSQDGLCKIFEMVLSAGDSILIEEPSYPGTLAALKPLGVRMIGVECDKDGLNPEKLKEMLVAWKNSGNAPKVLYLQPNCSNPTGVATSLDRRKEIIRLAKEYDLLVIEDDPYYFLTFDEKPLPSLFSLDQDGRVLRLDSFSKIISSGLRLGFVSGPAELVERVGLHLQVSSMHCSSLSQIILLTILSDWGIDGFRKHCRKVANFYESQCNLMLEAAEKHLTGLCTWNQPQGSMFLWLKTVGISDTEQLINTKALSNKVVLAPGTAFLIDSSKPNAYLRASYSNVNQDQMNLGLQRLRHLILEEGEAKS